MNENETENVMEQLNTQIASFEDDILLAQELELLKGNPLFKKLIIDTFINDNIQHLGLRYGITNEKNRELIIEQITARGILNAFLTNILESGKKAVQDIAQAQAYKAQYLESFNQEGGDAQ